MKKLFGIVLCLCLVITLIPMSAMAETETEILTYTAKAQGSLQNVAAAKPVTVTSAVWAADDSQTVQHTGSYLNDESTYTWWESAPDAETGEYKEGEYAIIDLTRGYEIYRIEMQFTSSATTTPATNIEQSKVDARSWEIYGSNNKYENYEKLGSFGSDDMNPDTQRILDLYGKKYRYIKIVKTSAEVARLYEVRVFGVEPAMIDVTPEASNIWTNKKTTDFYVDRLVDGKLGTFFHGPAPDDDFLRFTLDLGAKYKVRRVAIKFRDGGVTANGSEYASRHNFRIWAGNAADKTADIFDTEDAHAIINVGWTTTSDGSGTASYRGTIANGGQMLYFDSDSNEATQFVSMKWTSKAYSTAYSLAEIKVWAEDETAEEIALQNVATTLNEVKTGKTFIMDLGDYYNVKQIEVIPEDGSSLENFRVYGDAGNNMATTPVSHISMSAFLANQTDAITEAKKYDVESFNMVRFVTFESKAAVAAVPTVKVYAETGVKYENKALGKTVTGTKAASGLAGLTNGVVYNVSPTEMNMSSSTDMMYVDLGVRKRIEGFALNSAYIGKRNPSVSSGYIIWGSNNSDFSDKVMLYKDDIRAMRMTFGGDMYPVNKTGKYRYIGITYPAVGVSEGSSEYIYTIAAHAKFGTNGNMRKNDLIGDNKLTHATPSEYRKDWTELMVFTEIKDTNEIGYTDTQSALTDKNENTVSDFSSSPVVTLDRYYPIYSVSLENALDYDAAVSVSKDGVDYTPLGTIAAGQTTLEVDDAENFYKYVKFETASSAEVSQVNIYTFKKYAFDSIVAESCVFNDSKDGTGDEIYDLSSSVLGATVTARNLSNKAQDAILIVALYDENNMIIDLDVSLSKTIAVNGVETFSAGVNNSGDPVMLKAFLWESLGGLNPLSGSETLD